jgi:O-antigen/teichoic acid export membrane protein
MFTTYYLTPGELGQFALAQVWIMLSANLANFGLKGSYERTFFAYEQTDESAQLLHSALIFVLVNLIIIFGFLWIFESHIKGLILNNPDQSHLLLWIFLGIALSELSEYYLIFLKNAGLVSHYVKFTLIRVIVNFIVVLVLLHFFQFKTLSLAYGLVASNIVLLLILILHQGMPLSFNKRLLKEMLKIALPLTPKILLSSLNSKIDKMLLGAIGSTELVGVYHIGQSIALIVFQVMVALDKVFKPEFHRKLFANKYGNNSTEINNYILPFFYTSIFIALLFGLFSADIVAVLFSRKYNDLPIIAVILSINYAVIFFGIVTSAQLIQAKKGFVIIYLALFSLVLGSILNVIFIYYWGIFGAAWAVTVTTAISTIMGFLFAQKYIKIYWDLKSIFIVYAVYIFSMAFSLLSEMGAINVNGYLLLFCKISLVFIFIYVLSLNVENRRVLSNFFLKK